jgi:hypothetical protein
MNIQTLEQNSLRPTLQTAAGKINYTDLSRGAALNCIRASVMLETRVLHEYAELDPALGHNTAGVVFAVLLNHLASGNGGGDDRLTVCLTRRADGRDVELDLMVLRRRQAGGERFYLRITGVRENFRPD